MNKHFIALDTETGGLLPHVHDILTASFVVFNSLGVIVDELNLDIAPIGDYRVTQDALAVNKLSLVEHRKRAISREACKDLIIAFLSKYPKEDLIAIGHNVSFDFRFIETQIVPDMKQYFSQVMDTMVIAGRFIDRGFIKCANKKLTTLAAHFDLTYNAHDAREDSIMSFKIARKMWDISLADPKAKDLYVFPFDSVTVVTRCGCF